MSLFGALSIAGSGVDAMQTWIDTSGGNLANANDVTSTNQPAYATQTPVLTADPAAMGGGGMGQGVSVTAIALGSTTGLLEHQPGNPLADAQGNVRVPDVSMSDQLVGLIEAQDGYQADTTVMQRAQAAYQAGLTIGS